MPPNPTLRSGLLGALGCGVSWDDLGVIEKFGPVTRHLPWSECADIAVSRPPGLLPGVTVVVTRPDGSRTPLMSFALDLAPSSADAHQRLREICAQLRAHRPYRLGILREALTNLAMPADEQRRVMAGTVVTDELALDLGNAVDSIDYQARLAGVTLSPEFLADLRDLDAAFRKAEPEDPVWDENSLDDHAVWVQARRTASRLLAQLPEPVE